MSFSDILGRLFVEFRKGTDAKDEIITKLNLMKYLFIGLLFLLATNVYAQQDFLDSQESMDVVEAQKLTDESNLAQLPTSDPVYISLKNNLKSYQIFEDHLEGGLLVGESIMLAVLEVMPLNVSVDQYNADNFPDPELLRLKNHLVQLLSN
ncbi:hypothetical protein N9176_02060, partial [bacterium]|nr:hypothetical protein [bacterium]